MRGRDTRVFQIQRPTLFQIKNRKSTWKTILGWAIGIGVVLLAAIGGVNPPASLLARRYS